MYSFLRIQQHPQLIPKAAQWFHEKWEIPYTTYNESMVACVTTAVSVPQWYIVMNGTDIIAGLGVIDNDFHQRKDLTPNICAVYVDEPYRNQGIAGKLLQLACSDYKQKGFDALYLVTEHTCFYERYGWEFLCMVQETNTNHMTRMYQRKL